MSRYFSQVHYRDSTRTDDTGEEFATLQEAKAHANVVVLARSVGLSN
jgi:hypothetical protein